MNYILFFFLFFFLQYVSEVVIGAPFAVTKDLLDHFKVRAHAIINFYHCIGNRKK